VSLLAELAYGTLDRAVTEVGRWSEDAEASWFRLHIIIALDWRFVTALDVFLAMLLLKR
jgi:hypothetical protein